MASPAAADAGLLQPRAAVPGASSDAAAAAAAAGVSMQPVDASCEGVAGSISIDRAGNLTWTPLQAEQSKISPAPICPCPPEDLSFKLKQVLESAQLLGASTERDGALRVWYCEAVRSKAPGGGPKVQYKLKKTGRFDCSSPEAAEQLQQHIRRGASWWGRPHPPHMVVIYNPKSGTSKAGKVVSETLVPMLREAAGLRVTVQETSSAGHATRLVSELDLSDVDMLVYVGGDGTVYEGVQGLLNRPDWSTARAVPFAHVPGGSGNGLAASCGLWDPVTAAFAIAKGRTEPLDMASVLQPPGRRRYSFLSLVFGLWANIDIGTEANRWMGDGRYTLRAVQEAISAKPYAVRIAYWPHDSPGPEALRPVSPVLPVNPLLLPGLPYGGGTAAAAAGGTAAAAAGSPPWSQPPPAVVMEAKPGPRGGAPAPAPRRPAPGAGAEGRYGGGADDDAHAQLRTALLEGAGQRSSSGELPAHEGAAASAATAAPCGDSVGSPHPAPHQDLQQVPGFPSGPPLPILAAAWPGAMLGTSPELPPGWQLLPSTELQMMALYNVPFMATHARLNPRGRLYNGTFDLMYMYGQYGLAGRMRYADMLLASEEGGHVDRPFVHSTKVKALALQPLCTDTFLALDGEVLDISPVFIEVHPGLCSVCTAPEFSPQ